MSIDTSKAPPVLIIPLVAFSTNASNVSHTMLVVIAKGNKFNPQLYPKII